MRNVLVLALAILLLTGAGVGANLRPLTAIVNDNYRPPVAGKAPAWYPTLVRHFAAPPYPIDTVGGTVYDYQYNGPTWQTIAYDPEYGIHVGWMWSNIGDTTQRWSDRNMRYNFWDKTQRAWSFKGGTFMTWGVGAFGSRAGYGNLDVDPTNHCACLSGHINDPGTTLHLSIARDSAPGSGVFDSTPGPDGQIWPGLALTSTGTVHNATILDNNPTRTDLYYEKEAPGDTWTTPIDFPPPLSEPQWPSQSIAASKLSHKVAVTWVYYYTAPYPLYLRVSTDDGASWQTGVQIASPPAFHPGSETTSTFYLTGCYPFYDAQDSLHIVAAIEPLVGGSALTIPTEIWHWQVNGGWSRVARAQSSHLNGSIGVNALYACRPTLGEDANGDLVCVWEQFDSTNVEPTTSHLRADVWSALSKDGGLNWSDPLRITTPDSTSKRYPCIAARFPNDTFYVAYEVDLQAGFVIQYEAGCVSTNNPIIVERVPVSAMLPNRDVGVLRITSPHGDTVDSGAVVTPSAVVKNFGATTERFGVRCRIGSFYARSQSVDSLAPGDTAVVSFSNWTADRLGTYAVKCTTLLLGDRDPSNDAQISTVTVGDVVIDAGATTILAPTGSLDSGAAPVHPQAVVRNFGDRVASFPAVFTIGTRYRDTVLVSDLASQDSITLTFAPWTAQERGSLVARCSTKLEGDGNQADDAVSGSVRVIVHDVGVTEIIAPTGHVDSGTAVTPQAEARNFGTEADTFWVRMTIGTSYRDSLYLDLPQGDSTTVLFDNWTATKRGWNSVRCATLLTGDMVPGNDLSNDSVRVDTPHVGITQLGGRKLPTRFAVEPGGPNPFSGHTIIRLALPVMGDLAIRVFDANGALVRSVSRQAACPGYYDLAWDGCDNAGRRVGSGLYFCSVRSGEQRGMIKVVKTE